MFEDSSSEEDEKPSVPADKKPIVDDDDDDDEEEDGKDNGGDASIYDDGGDKKKSSQVTDGNNEKTKNSEKKSPPMVGLFDDSSDDEDDAVFDDAGAVVGSSAPLNEKKTSGRVLDGIDDDDTENNSGNNRSSSKITGKNYPPQNVSVLEADRPEPGITLHMTKLPNVVAIQPTAFDEADYDENDEEEQYKGYVHNMVRWRYKRDENGGLVRDGEGSLVRESNSKLVKWSDGSFTLHIGKESFDIQNVDSSNSDGFTGLNGYVYLSQKATFRNGNDEKEGEESQQNGGTVLECIGPVASRLVAKPSSLQSDAHKSLTVAVRQRTTKKAKIAAYMTEEDPEKLKQERIKYNTDADKLKQRKRTTGSSNHRSGDRRNPGMNRSYLEASDEEGYDTVNIRKLKKGSNYDMDAMDDYGDDSDDDYGQSYVNRNRKRQRKSVDEDSEDEEEMVFDDEDEEEVTMYKKKKQSHTAVLDDDE